MSIVTFPDYLNKNKPHMMFALCCAGLLRDDTLEENELVKEAIRRLPDRVYDERMYRISRALNLSNQKTVLPKSEWAKFEDVSMTVR